MNRTRFIQGLNSNIELSDKERRRAIRNSINKRPWKLNCTIAMEVNLQNSHSRLANKLGVMVTELDS